MTYTATITSLTNHETTTLNNVVGDDFLPNNTNVRLLILEDQTRIEIPLTNCFIKFCPKRSEAINLAASQNNDKGT
jgi:hypothetical protein